MMSIYYFIIIIIIIHFIQCPSQSTY